MNIPKKLECKIPPSLTSYEIKIQSGILNDPKTLIQHLTLHGSRYTIITDETIASLYGNQLYKVLSAAGLETFLFSFPVGEQHKTRATKEHLEDQLFEKKLGRDTCVIAIGGGVVTDLGGYIAATYCRGIPLIIIPTSLLGMVDASIGGKNGVNTPHGKNMLGCIYQPKKVIIDPSTLKSLPIKELKNGVVEMIKHGLISDSNYFTFLEEQADQILELDSTTLEIAIFESCRIKKEIVEQDEKEKGIRHLLNFGHTFGHALEVLTHYSVPHGEAVACGLLFESHLAVQLGKLKQSSFERIKQILARYSLPLHLPSPFSFNQLLDAMKLDKKSLKGQPCFSIISEIGTPLMHGSSYCTTMDKALIENTLHWIKNDLRRD
ncbi:MAG TPA: 3-dehydroquinate synthase [Waddliaceae bacterium]